MRDCEYCAYGIGGEHANSCPLNPTPEPSNRERAIYARLRECVLEYHGVDSLEDLARELAKL